MPLNLFIQLLIVVALNVVAFLFSPRPKGPMPREVQDLEEPTAEAGRPIPVVFGTTLIKSPNVLWFGENRSEQSDY